jgi:flagellar protein FliS
MNAYLNQYQNNSVMTASPEKVLIMLYDGAIRFVRQARQAIKDSNQADKSKAIGKAIAIITEFSNTLDHEIGGEIAADLSRLYDYMVRELSAVNARNTLKKLDSVEHILQDLRDAFAGAIEINNRNAAQQQSVDQESGQQRVVASY